MSKPKYRIVKGINQHDGHAIYIIQVYKYSYIEALIFKLLKLKYDGYDFVNLVTYGDSGSKLKVRKLKLNTLALAEAWIETKLTEEADYTYEEVKDER